MITQLVILCLSATSLIPHSFGDAAPAERPTSAKSHYRFVAEFNSDLHTTPRRFHKANRHVGIVFTEAAVIPVSFAAQGGHSIGGTVLDTSRRPVPDLHVELLDDVEMMVKRARTDSAGRYTFTGLSTNTYYIRVQTFGTSFVSQTVRVPLVNVSLTPGRGRQYEEVSFVLKTIDEEKPRAGAKDPSTVFTQAVPDSARKLYEEAIQTLDETKDPVKGIEQLKKAIEVFPTYYLALERLGAEYVKQKQYDLSLEASTKAVQINPKGHMGFHTLGVAQYNLKRMSESVESLKRAVSLAPTSLNSQFWLGIVLFRSGKMKEAEEPLERASRLGGSRIPDVHMFLAQIYSNTNRYKEAADELELFLKETPDARDSQSIQNLIVQLRAKAKK